MDFSTHAPVKIVTGRNCVSESADKIAALGSKALIVSGKSSADKCGAFADVVSVLDSANIPYVRFNKIPENPPAEMCCEAGELCCGERCDFIIAIGGGSALDASKAIAAYAANPQCGVMDIYDDAVRINPGLPLVLIPTTSGTGSEANRYSILTIDNGRKKKTFKHTSAYAALALVSPKYTETLNEDYTVSTALDTLAHAIESYFSPKSCDASREAAVYAAREVWDVIFRGADSDGLGEYTMKQRERLAYAATAGGIAIDYTGTGFPHPLGYSLTLTRGIPHGKACAIFEGAYLKYNIITTEGKRLANELAEAIGVTVDEMIEEIPKKSGIELVIDDESEREELIDRVAGAGNYANSPYIISRGEMSDIYKRLFKKR